MIHRFYEGEVFHKRFKDAEHKFTYGFFMLDIDVASLTTLKNRFFAYDSFNLFSFKPKDHFGSSNDFKKNIEDLLQNFQIKTTSEMRFLTLPRVFNYVFNPISILVLLDAEGPKNMMVEVHN